MLPKILIAAVLVIVFLAIFRRRKSSSDSSPKLPKASLRPGSEPEEAADDDEAFRALVGTVVILEGNDWSACTVDGITEPWTRFTGDPPRGMSAISAGRHRVTTVVDGEPATLDFLIRPGEILAWSLDREERAWEPVKGASLDEVTRLAKGGERGKLADALIRYRSTMGIARVQAGLTIRAPDSAFIEAKTRLEALTARLDARLDDDAHEAALAHEAKAIGDMLLGIPLTRAQIDGLLRVCRGEVRRAALAC